MYSMSCSIRQSKYLQSRSRLSVSVLQCGSLAILDKVGRTVDPCRFGNLAHGDDALFMKLPVSESFLQAEPNYCVICRK